MIIARIDQLIRQRGEPLEGNICYWDREHGREFAPGLAAKRQLWQQIVTTVAHCVEIGVNAGHSAALALAANPRLGYTGIDPCIHGYTLPCWEIIAEEYGARVQLIPKGSPGAFSELELIRPAKYLWSIDGDHSQQGCERDIQAVTARAEPGDLLWIDDTTTKTVRRAIKSQLDSQWISMKILAKDVRLYRRESLAAKPR